MVKKITIVAFLLIQSFYIFSQKQFHFEIPGYGPHLIEFDEINAPPFMNPNEILKNFYPMADGYEWRMESELKDALGFTHHRGQLYRNNVLVYGSNLIFHVKNNKVQSINGHFYLAKPTNVLVKKENLIQKAIELSGGNKFMWENKEQEQSYQESMNDSHATYFPKPILKYIPQNNDFESEFKLVFAIKIFASEPLSHKEYHFDAQNWKYMGYNELLCDIHDTGIAHTKYSGKREIYTNRVNSNSYTLVDSIRKITTMNANRKKDNSKLTNFSDSNNVWNNVNSFKDEAATDAHWGAEMTYDYFKQKFNRTSYDNKASKMTNYVHYDSNLYNAYWIGTGVYYGDGVGNPLTSLDVCGHEIGHGVTGTSAGLNYAYESGALNESFSDIFGNSIEQWARPNKWSWKIAEDITQNGNGIRNMSKSRYYKGNNWYSGTGDNGGVHTNSAVQNYWYYLITEGDTGVNEVSNSFQVQGIGFNAASQIAYRNLSVYLTNSSNYEEAKIYSIRSAGDLYGACSKEKIAVTNAWYAVGIGSKYDSGLVVKNFMADSIICKSNTIVKFTNLSENFLKCQWNFGDGDTSSQINPSHQYTGYGNYSVKLKVLGCFNNKWDSITKNSYIKIDSTQDICNAVIMAVRTNKSVEYCKGYIYDAGGEGPYVDNYTWLTVTSPGADSIELKFVDLDLGKNDSILLYNGNTFYGSYKGNILPYSGKSFFLKGNKISIFQYSFNSNNYTTRNRGFKLYFKAYKQPLSVIANNDTVMCKGSTRFKLYAKATGGYINDYRFIWNNDTIAKEIYKTPLNDTFYTIRLRDVCMNTNAFDTVRVDILDPLKISKPKDTIICVGGSANIKLTANGGLKSKYKYKWNDGNSQSTRLLSPKNTTTYKVTLTDNCTVLGDTVQFKITLRPSLKLKLFSNDSIFCITQKAVIKAITSGGDSFNRKVFWGNSILPSDSIKFQASKSTWIKANLKDGCSPTVKDSIYIKVLDSLSYKKSNDTIICAGGSASIGISAKGGKTQNYSYIWNHSIPNTASYNVTLNSAQKYYFSISDGCSPTVLDSIFINVFPSLKLSKPSDSLLCYGQEININLLPKGGKGSNYKVSWNNGLDTGFNKTLQPFSKTKYQIILSDACTILKDTQEFILDVAPPLKISVVPSASAICKDEKVVIKVSAIGGKKKANIYYNNQLFLKDSIIEFPLNNKNDYKFSSSDGCSYTDSQTISITVNALPLVNISANKNKICLGDSIIFSSNFLKAKNYSWKISDGSFQYNEFAFWRPAKIGVYNSTLTLLDSNNCKGFDTLQQSIEVIDNPLANFNFNPQDIFLSNPEVTFNNLSKFSNTFLWDFGDGITVNSVAPLHKYSDTGIYNVKLIAKNEIGCTDILIQTLRIKENNINWLIPNAFSPNGDLINEGFGPLGFNVSDFKLKILNRWGEIIFISNYQNKFWNGKLSNGQLVEEGNYIYLLELIDKSKTTHFLRGSILVLR